MLNVSAATLETYTTCEPRPSIGSAALVTWKAAASSAVTPALSTSHCSCASGTNAGWMFALQTSAASLPLAATSSAACAASVTSAPIAVALPPVVSMSRTTWSAEALSLR